ncbi:MAG: antitoxin [Actinomycetaceae bacterium]|nr:antitoxin [Actinomycetaceae bacterium]
MDLGNLKNKATEALSNLSKDEAKTDAALDKAAELAKKVSGGKFDDKIDQMRAEADKHLGNEDDSSQTTPINQ